jgi:hypothetical protein
MIRFLLALSFTFVLFAGYAQPRDTLTIEQQLERRGGIYLAQTRPTKYLALDVNHALGGFHRYRFFPGDELHFKARGEKFREELYAVSDTTFTILMANEVMNRDEPVSFRFDEVQKVMLHRRIPFVTAAGTLFPLAGVIYGAADLIRDRQFNAGVVPVVAGLIVSGGLFHLLSNPRIHINKNHRLRVLQTY